MSAGTAKNPRRTGAHQSVQLLVAAPTPILLLVTDGDHVADERTVWFDGGSITGCGNDLHGPYLGPDGYFYWCKGAFAAQSHVLGNGKTFNTSAAHLFRSKPDGSDLDVVITGGMDNPVGLAFSESGERFVSGTFFDLSKPGRRDGILHAVYGGMWGKALFGAADHGTCRSKRRFLWKEPRPRI